MVINNLIYLTRKIYSNFFLNKYPDLKEIIKSTNKSISTGTELTDYIYLYRFIKRFKPQIVLECGTGKSTFVIAHAMKKYSNKNSKLVSMESVKKYYTAQKKIFPKKKYPFVEIKYSPLKLYTYSFISGTGYSKIPDYKYDFVFVDGHLGSYKEKFQYEPGKINIDFLNIILKNKTLSINAIIDNRKLTTWGYSLLFGKNIVNFNKFFSLGIIKQASFKKLMLKKGRYKESHFKSFVNSKVF